MRNGAIIAFILLLVGRTFGQSDSSEKPEPLARQDTSYVLELVEQANEVISSSPDSAIFLGQLAIKIAGDIGYSRGLVNGLGVVGYALELKGDNDKALDLYHSAFKEAYLLENSKTEASFLNYIGIVHLSTANYEIANDYFHRSRELSLESSDTLGVIKTIINQGEVSRRTANYSESFAQFQQAIQLIEQIGDSAYLSKVLINLGGVYAEIKNFQSARKYFRMAESLLLHANQPWDLSLVLGNIGETYREEGMHDSASVYFFKSLDISESLGNVPNQTITYNNLAALNVDLGNWELAEEFSEKNLALSEEIGDSLRITLAHVNLGTVHLDQGLLEEAHSSFLHAYAVANAIGDLEQQSLIAEQLSEITRKMGDLKAALSYNDAHKIFRDSLINLESAQELARIQSKFETRKKEQQIKMLQTEMRIQEIENSRKTVQWIFMLFGLLVLAAGIVLYLVLRRRRENRLAAEEQALIDQKLREERMVAEAKAIEREEISMDLHDDVTAILSMISVHIKNLGSDVEELNGRFKARYDVLISLAEKANNRVRTYSHTLASKTLPEHGLEIAIVELLDEIDKSGKVETSQKLNGLDIELPFTTSLSIFRIIQELLNNVLQHADASTLYLEVVQQHNLMWIAVKDNGIGFEVSDKAMSVGIGLGNVSKRVAQFGGEIDIQSNVDPARSGTHITIKIPL